MSVKDALSCQHMLSQQMLFGMRTNKSTSLTPYSGTSIFLLLFLVGKVHSVSLTAVLPRLNQAVSIGDDGTEKRVCIDGKQRLTTIQR